MSKPPKLKSNQKKISRRLKKIVGIVEIPEGFDEKKDLLEYFEKKHLI